MKLQIIALAGYVSLATAIPAAPATNTEAPGYLWFWYLNKPGSNKDCDPSKVPSCQCGEVDAAAVTPTSGAPVATSRVPAALFKPWNAWKLKAYADLTVQLYSVAGANLELGRCAEIGYTRKNSQTPGVWAPTSMMTEICQQQCDCTYPSCPDVPDEPLKGKWCSLCGPKYNANFYVQLYAVGSPSH